MLSAAYPHMKEVDEVMVEIWYECLKDVDAEIGIAAIKKNILESPYPPTIADIRKQVSEVTTPEEDRLDGAEAWGEVVKAMGEYGTYRKKEALESMSQTTRKVVKYMGWREICLSENIGVIRGQFLKMYGTVAEREKQNRLLPGDFKKEINKLAESNKSKVLKLAENLDMNKAINKERKQEGENMQVGRKYKECFLKADFATGECKAEEI